MKQGEMVRIHMGQDAHGQGGFVVMGTVIDENNHVLVVDPLAFLLVKNDVGSIEELPDGSVVQDALRTVQLGRESYHGTTTPLIVTQVGLADGGD